MAPRGGGPMTGDKQRSDVVATREAAATTTAASHALPLAPHVTDVAEVCRHFGVDLETGLSQAAVLANLARFGHNELEHEEPKSLWTLFFEQFQDLLARILLMAALVSFLLSLVSGHEEGITAFVEPFVILLILIANAIVSVWQESNAEKSLEALKRLQPELARVLRDGRWLVVPTLQLVPGDIVEVHVGDRVPADLRVSKVHTVSLRAEQSQLTGEAQTVVKEAGTMEKSYEDCEVQAKTNILFGSTTVANGSATAIVVATGMQSEIGKIQCAVQAAKADEERTPLQQKLDEFGEMLSKAIGMICTLVWVINFGNFSEPSHGGFLRGCIYYFKTAVALAVAAIPEGLTAVITTCLALGTRKMAAKNAIVRRLPSVETLGCTTVICSDKTGTLTTNQMSCVRFALPDTAEGSLTTYTVEGHTYSPVGRVYRVQNRQQRGDGGSPETPRSSDCRRDPPSPVGPIGQSELGLQYFVRCASLCNQARLEVDQANPATFLRHGEPTEAALKVG